MDASFILNHLLELRRRALHVMVVLLSLSVLFFLNASYLFHQLLLPLLHVLPGKDPLIATQLTTPLLTPLKLAIHTALLCTTPYALLQLWLFVSPGLYPQERRPIAWTIFGSLSLFCMGVLFCFYVILPTMLHFFVQMVPEGVHLLPDISYAVDLMTHMLLLFGLCFQVPLICLLLVYLHIISIATLKTIRPYVIVAAFTIGMLLTPPDVLSQIMLAVPLCLLYELGILLAWLVIRTPVAQS